MDEPVGRGYGMNMRFPDLAAYWLPKQMDAPHPVPFAGGCGMFMDRTWFQTIGGFDSMRIYGLEDLEISLRTWLLGGRVYVVPRAEVSHYFRTQATCSITWSRYIYNALRFALLHLDGTVLDNVLSYWRAHPDFQEAWTQVEASDIYERRNRLRSVRMFDFDWFRTKFSLELPEGAG